MVEGETGCTKWGDCFGVCFVKVGIMENGFSGCGCQEDSEGNRWKRGDGKRRMIICGRGRIHAGPKGGIWTWRSGWRGHDGGYEGRKSSIRIGRPCVREKRHWQLRKLCEETRFAIPPDTCISRAKLETTIGFQQFCNRQVRRLCDPGQPHRKDNRVLSSTKSCGSFSRCSQR